MTDQIIVTPYDPAWPTRFRIEVTTDPRRAQRHRSRHRAHRQHLGARTRREAIIDMLVGVHSLDGSNVTRQRLAIYGYEYIPEYERVLPDRRFFKRVVRGVRTHHVHVVEFNGVYWKRYLKFRDNLRADAWLAARYAELKRRLAARFRFDRDAYTNGKTGFVEAVLAMPGRAASIPMRVRPHFAFAA